MKVKSVYGSPQEPVYAKDVYYPHIIQYNAGANNE